MPASTTSAAPSVTGRRTRDEKYDERRGQLADSALQTLGELGYARTSLREIAQNSPFSHGVVHYYFAGKDELIIYCVQRYKAACVTRYDELVATSTTPSELADRFCDKLVETLRDEAPLHRLWYDLRSQALFEDALRADVVEIDRALEAMIWRVLTRYAELAGRAPAFDSPLSYALLDGLFEQAVVAHAAGEPAALALLGERASRVLPTLLSPVVGTRRRP
ncbi:MAG TPA: TetR/AcrR family transcriptional regulator [Marmoricola sp.]|jgi:AcrR family transcriptional regulator|nr:TetR/AcrR family transcriptional regulator [Marmoricola sp.]